MMTGTTPRPQTGWIEHPDGARTPLRFVPDPDDTTGRLFLATYEDGRLADVSAADHIHIDMLGPGQSVYFDRTRERDE